MGYGGFYFYSQHLVEIVCEIFGRFPKSVLAVANGDNINVVFRYETYDVNGLFVEGGWKSYFAVRSAFEGTKGDVITIDDGIFLAEWEAFYKVLSGEKGDLSYEEFIAPVFVLNAIDRSLQSGKEEKVTEFTV